LSFCYLQRRPIMARSLKSKRTKRLNTVKRGKLQVIMSERSKRQQALDAEMANRKVLPSATVNGHNWREYVMHLNSQSLKLN
ncbi:hypothetical protein BVRB_029290, partial [Beta vulgaris subsp. vulgaris]